MDNKLEDKNHQEGSKKSPFDDLSRDELISKCKGLLAIAQKARQSKQELQNELDSYKVQFEQFDKEKKTNEDNLRTLQELVDSLTEQKLNVITNLESAHSKVKSLSQNCTNFEEQINNYKADIILKEQSIATTLQSLSNLDSENISLKRQNQRLSEENDQLLTQLSELEARTIEFNNIGLQQRNQLKELEEKILTEHTLKAQINELNIKITELEDKLQTCSNDNELEKQVLNYENKIKEVTQLYENEKVKKEKSNIKLKSYKDKILKCATCINQLKNSRLILSKTVKEYSESIPKWQNDIIAASVVLDNQIKQLNEENTILKENISKVNEKLRKKSDAENESNEYSKMIESLSKELSELKLKNNELTNMATNEINTLKYALDTMKTKYDTALLRNKENEDQLKDLHSKNLELNDMLQKCNVDKAMEKLELQIRALESEKAILVKEKLTARDNATEFENQNNILSGQVNKMRTDIENMKVIVNNVSQEKAMLETNNKAEKNSQINNIKGQLTVLQEQYDLLKKEFESVNDLNGLLKEEVETLKLSLEQPKDESDNLPDSDVSLQADIVKLETKLSAYKQENCSLLAEVKESRIKIKDIDAIMAENEDAKLKLLSYKTENTELLNEMKEINQVLKERGENISKLQKAIAEMERLIDTLEKDRDTLSRENEILRKNSETLENDLKDAQKKTCQEIDNTQLISAEKDNAIKELAQRDAIILSLKDELDKIRQQSCSAGDYTNEDMSTSTISRAEENARMRDLDETFEEKYTKLRIFALKLKKKLNETTVQLQNTIKDKERLAKVVSEADKTMPLCNADTLDSEVNVNINQSVVSDLEAKIKTLTTAAKASENIVGELEAVRADLANKTHLLNAEIEAHKTTIESLEKARRDVKKKNVLSLEMEDYEKSMKDLTAKMDETKKKMMQMESTIDTQEGTISAMKVQISLLEEQVKTDETQNRLAKEELQTVIDESKDKDNIIQVKNSIISNLEQNLEDEKRKNEEVNLETTSLLSEKEKIIMSLGHDKAELKNKTKRLEFKCAELNDQLRNTKIELDDLNTEYTSYKVRAQAILRQNQTVDHSQEEHLKEENSALKSHIETLETKVATLQAEWSEASEVAAAAQRRAAESASEVTRAQQRTARLTTDLNRLANTLESERTQHKLQISTLTQCYKTQIADLDTRLHKELDDLRNQLTIAQEISLNLPGTSAIEDSNRNQYVVPVIPKDDSDGEMDINVSMIPREEGEGSESAPSPPPSKQFSSSGGGGGRSPVPLERLLEEGVPEDDVPDSAALALTSEQEITDLRRKLISQQERVKHVTVLLSESERECARMGQLSELLKAELRRVRGSSAVTHNAEYMKNVTLKFLTLPPGDERSRLVPVLQKILTLTNEETHKINAVAKGLDPNPNKGWGSYLPWPGGK